MNDTLDLKEALTLAQASLVMRGRGLKNPACATLRRWANPNRGRLVHGRKIWLRSVRLGHDVLTCAKWIADFEAACVAAAMAGK